MCTCITYENGDFYFGRNMDLEYRFGEKVVIMPRNFRFPLKEGKPLNRSYAMIGMASVAEGCPLYAEAVNEKGLTMAGLNFPGNAIYRQAQKDMKNITPYELIPWVLGQCENIKETALLLKDLNLLNTPFSENLPLAPLHWMISGRDGSLVLESVEDGVHLYENPFGVLTNNPPFPYYQYHLGNYRNLTPLFPENHFAADSELPVLGQGLGAVGLPGDFSPVSRFVKAAFMRTNARSEKNEMSNISQMFHMLEGVSMVRGAVVTGEGKYDITTYSCCINADKGIYYYRTYENSAIQAINLHHEDLDAEVLKIFGLSEQQQIKMHN